MTRISDHAKKRIKKRVGTKHIEEQFGAALLEGVRLSDTKGDLRRYLGKSAWYHESDCVIYKGFVYWHQRTNLITVIPLPQKFQKYLK